MTNYSTYYAGQYYDFDFTPIAKSLETLPQRGVQGSGSRSAPIRVRAAILTEPS